MSRARRVSSCERSNDLTAITWLEVPEKFTYLREGLHATTRRTGKIKLSFPARLIAYEDELPKHGYGIATYRRRIWYLKPQDWDISHDVKESYSPAGGLSPVEAVFPDSVSLEHKSIRFSWEEWRQKTKGLSSA